MGSASQDSSKRDGRQHKGKHSPTYPAPTQQMLRTGLARDVASDSAIVDNVRLLLRCLGVKPRASSSTASGFLGRSSGLKVRLPSGVVGAVEVSRKLLSSESTREGEMRFMVAGFPSIARDEDGMVMEEMNGRCFQLYLTSDTKCRGM